MKDRGKRELEAYNNGDCIGESFPDFPCKKHPPSSSSSGGICAYCLTDRLVQLVCQQCGEQKLTSCSCSEINSSSNSSTTDVGRISFLLEKEKKGVHENPGSKAKHERNSSDNKVNFTHLRRSNSISATSKRSETAGKFWKIKRLFRKKREKINHIIKNNEKNNNSDECNGVTRSRSLCGFRGFYDTEEIGGIPASYSAARASSVSTGNFVLDSAKRSCFSESEARISNFDYCESANIVGPNKNNNIFSLKETEFVSSDDPAFIDLKLHDSNNNNSMSSSDHSKVPDLAAMKRNGVGFSTREFGFRGGDEMFNNGGGSCRISSCIRERELKKCRKSNKVWKWFFKPHTSSVKFDDHA